MDQREGLEPPQILVDVIILRDQKLVEAGFPINPTEIGDSA
ncbi:MAG: hypothetical protein ACLQU2_29560 [Candidatus Binataceae bacterium]